MAKSSFYRNVVVTDKDKIEEIQNALDKEMNLVITSEQIELFKDVTAEVMRKEGASEEFIKEKLTNNEVQFAINNDISPKVLAWGLLF